MGTELEQRLLAHFRPLIGAFVSELEGAGLDVKPGSPQPFFPVFGEAYERSSLRIVIVGQDTRGWGCLKRFMEMEKAAPGSALEDDLAEFRDLDFKNCRATRYTFLGFAMMFLAALHGRSDWGVMKRGAYPEILSSFAWSNGNAVEYFNSSPKAMPWDQWELVRKAGERFNGLRHLVEAIGPRVVVVLWKDMNPAAYIAGYEFTQLEEAGGIRHFRVPAANVDVFQTNHPVRMRWEGVSADDVCAQLVARLQANNLSVAFPGFVQHSSDSEDAIAYLKKSAPPQGDDFDKFKFVECVAEELKKRGSFMSAPTLARLLNELGFETDHGCDYVGVRGTYNLISGTYKRLEREGRDERAGMVAEAFRKPNFDYAYEV